MNVEVRIAALEERVAEPEVEMKSMKQKLHQALEAVTDVNNDLLGFRADMAGLRRDLPDIIARSVAPLIAGKNGN